SGCSATRSSARDSAQMPATEPKSSVPGSGRPYRQFKPTRRSSANLRPVPRELTIDGVRIADDTDCWVIAEIGHNHGGSLETCKQLFKAAAECGAQAVKLQKRDNVGLYTKEMYNRPYDNENSYGPTYGTHRDALGSGPSEYEALKAYAAELGVTFFSTAFDFKSAEFLADLDMPAYKIASGDLTNTPLLKFVAELGKPMVVSTGGGTMDDVR